MTRRRSNLKKTIAMVRQIVFDDKLEPVSAIAQTRGVLLALGIRKRKRRQPKQLKRA